MRSLSILVAALVLLAACADSGGESSTPTTTSTTLGPISAAPAPPTTATAPPTTTAAPTEPRVPDQLAGLEPTVVTLDDQSLLVAVADTSALRRSGLMFVEDLGDLDGMLFVFDADTNGGFWMKNTLLPLDIAFFDVDGGFVDGFVMEPCTADPCPTYVPSGSYRYALETAAGTMPENPRELTLHLGADEAEES